MTRDLARLSRLMSVVLRHKPEGFGVVLDAEGYTPLTELVAALRAREAWADESAVRAVVATNDPVKQRFSIVGDDIRANYGHSVAGRIAHDPAIPPEVLFHGTAATALASILSAGLSPMRRQYVHLTVDRELALRVGSRHGLPCLVCVEAGRARRDGVRFYRANRSFWLADHVPARFLDRAP